MTFLYKFTRVGYMLNYLMHRNNVSGNSLFSVPFSVLRFLSVKQVAPSANHAIGGEVQ